MKIYIAEDEPLAAAKLKLFLEKLGEGNDISLFDNGVSALAGIDKERPDLLFLDIQMPGMTGMEVLQRISGIPIIITSAYDQYAIESYSLNVTDYLLKPYTIERLQMAIEKGKKAIRMRQFEEEAQRRQFVIRVDGATEILNPDDILYLEALKDYVNVVLVNNRQRLTLGSLSGFESQLTDSSFVRVHRSYLVNPRKIATQGTASLTMTDGKEIPVGKTYRQILPILI